MAEREPKLTWRDALEGAIKEASEDPEAFLDNVKATARSASSRLDGIYRTIREHPDVPKREATKAAIKAVASKIRREFRF